MDALEVEQYLQLLPLVRQSPDGQVWSSYDAQADVLYVNFRKPSRATGSEITDNDVIIRYEDASPIGITVLHASQRIPANL